MDDYKNLLAIIGGLITLVLFLAGGVAVLKSSIMKGTITAYEASNKALTERVQVLEASDLKKTTEIESLKRENITLLEQRPSAELIAEINKKLDKFLGLLVDGNKPKENN